VPTVTNNILYRDIGVSLQVTPKINADGSVVMRVIPEVSSISPTSVDLGNGVTATAFNVQTVETTVIAQDGETVVLGGLITKRDEKNENKIPWFGDLPGVGALFRFRNEIKEKRELLVILTPHIVRSPSDADRMFGMEAKRMNWQVGDVLKSYGTSGMEPILPNYQPLPPTPPPMMTAPQLYPHVFPQPARPEVAPRPRPIGPKGPGEQSSGLGVVTPEQALPVRHTSAPPAQAAQSGMAAGQPMPGQPMSGQLPPPQVGSNVPVNVITTPVMPEAPRRSLLDRILRRSN
jgi:hypothetical protein